ncbi:hypothetical protein [Thioalkalivibrio sp.]|uniref:hypothetical protein n=1 Tax=Thioalkalivibrio sp. TaxID=2093813 RepID=UPI003569A3C5
MRKITDEEQELVRRALNEPRLTLEDMSAATGRSLSSLEKYRMGYTGMPAEVKRRLAAFLEDHAARLREIAAELRKITKD